MPKIIGSTLAEHRQRTRNRLFEALSELLSERAFESLTMAEIAKTAGVGRTAVYNHFPDKEALLLAFIAHETEQYSQKLEASLTHIVDPVHGLRVYIRSQLELGAAYSLAPGRDLRKVVSEETEEKLHHHGDKVAAILERLLKELMESNQIPEQDTTILVSLINATLAGRTLPKEPMAREYLILSVQSFILRAVGVAAEVINVPGMAVFEQLRRSGSLEHAVDEFGASACPVHH